MPSVVFISNYYTHHQSAFSEEMFKLCEGKFNFIETEEMEEERTAMGWTIEKPSFVRTPEELKDNTEKIIKLITDSDIAIIGSAPIELVSNRLKMNKLTFAYSERIYKKGCKRYKLPLHALRLYKKYGRHKNLYLLCSSAYAAYDYSRALCFRGKTYKWGYFPEVKEYESEAKLSEWKHPASILWAARLIEWKHPELPVLLAERLKEEGYKFQLNLIGNGEMEEEIKGLISQKGLEDCVHMLGSMKPYEVREHMEKASIYLFTSDRNEGWGAVLNESMNSGCAVVASSAIGAVPYMIKNGENGIIYKDGDFDSLYSSVKTLLDDKSLCEKLGRKAYNTMLEKWNASVAAKRLLKLNEELKNKGECNLFDEGPCSKAEIIKDGWYEI